MKYPLFFAIVCAAMTLISCKKTGITDEVLTLSKQTVALGGDLETKDTIIVSSNTSWQIVGDDEASWLNIEPRSGEGNAILVISANQRNIGTNRRTASLQVKTSSGTKSFSITIVQFQSSQVLVNSVFGGELHDVFRDFTATSDGGYIAVGLSNSGQGDATGAKGNYDVWIVKFDGDGNKQWHKMYGGTQNDIGYSIVRTASGNYLILASTFSAGGDVTNHKGATDVWLLNIDESGNLLWQKTIGGSDDDVLYRLRSLGDGNFLMAGWTKSNDADVALNHGATDAWIVKVNGDGEILWQKTFGGSEDDMAFDATAVSNGGYIFSGTVSSNDGDAEDRSGSQFSSWLVKINDSGIIGGKRYLGDSGSEFALVAREAGNGDYIFMGETNSVGEFSGYHGSRDIFVCRLTSGGDYIWRKAYGGSLEDEPTDLIETADGHFLIAGLSGSNDGNLPQNLGTQDAWVFKLNGEGAIESNTTFGGFSTDNAYRLKQLDISHYAFVGGTGSFEDDYAGLDNVMSGWFQIFRF
jgi:hypothetical protein